MPRRHPPGKIPVQHRRVFRRGVRLILMVLALLAMATVPPLGAQEFDADAVMALFPEIQGTLDVGPVAGTPPAAPVTAGGKLVGYALSTRAVAGSVGFSGRPLDIHIGLTSGGKVAGARLVAHQEPILVIGISPEQLEAFVSGFTGLDVRRGAALRGQAAKQPGTPDHVTGASVSSAVMHDAILRSARAVAASRGIIGASTGKARLNMNVSNKATWDTLASQGAVARRTVSRGDAVAALGASGPAPDGLFIDLFAVLVTPPMIGQNLLGRRTYERLTAGMAAQDNAILIAANGLYSFKGTEWRRSGVFDRIQIVQGTRTIILRKQDYSHVAQLAPADAPEFREIGVFRIPAEAGFDPVAPWRIELMVMREDESGSPRTASFSLEYRLPGAFIVPASGSKAGAGVKGGEPELWMQIWQARLPEVAVLLTMLAVLIVILFFQDLLVRSRDRYRATRIAYLSVTLVFLGFYAGAQLSVVNVVTFTHALLSGFKWELFLLDPLVFILWGFVAMAMLFWGRGVFCGWLCPFGALQELLNEAARKLGIKQIEIPWGLHERLWPIKYIAFLLILGISLQSIIAAYQIAEVEPFKTVIILKFIREWPFVLYALLLVVMGLFIERFYCRYLCPLGAALAIPARLKLFDWLKRRQQCGRECRICNTTCTVQAINPLGQITPNECIYCLQCQANYHDATTCLPLKMRAQRRAGSTAPGPKGGNNAG